MNRKTLIVIFLLLILGLCATYLGFRIWFKSDINMICNSAMSQYEGDKIEALIALLNAEDQTLEAKNYAIWALGKLRDKRALPVLKKLQTGTECNHKKFVCQRELDKAIKNLEGESIDILTFK